MQAPTLNIQNGYVMIFGKKLGLNMLFEEVKSQLGEYTTYEYVYPGEDFNDPFMGNALLVFKNTFIYGISAKVSAEFYRTKLTTINITFDPKKYEMVQNFEEFPTDKAALEHAAGIIKNWFKQELGKPAYSKGILCPCFESSRYILETSYYAMYTNYVITLKVKN